MQAAPEQRFYRDYRPAPAGRVPFRVQVETTDLYLRADRDLSTAALAAVRRARGWLKAHIATCPDFATALQPLEAPPGALPPLVGRMYAAGRAAGVGPMAAVAGAVAEQVGTELRALSGEVLVENGGDLYLDLRKDATVGLYAGTSPFSGRIGLRIGAAATPLAVCTSSGTVGPSLSFGVADAAVAVAGDAALADAVATALGNHVRRLQDLEPAVSWALSIPGVLGAVAVMGARLAVRGEVELVQVEA